MSIPKDQVPSLLWNELYLRRQLVLILFVSINIIGIGASVLLPRSYESSTVVLIEDKDILDPDLQVQVRGRRGIPAVRDRYAMAKDVLFGPNVMVSLARDLGLVNEGSSEQEKEQAAGRLAGKTTLTNLGRGLLQISYRDSDPRKAYETMQRLTDVFIVAIHQHKLEASTQSFEFIDKQAREYQRKIHALETRLRSLRSSGVAVSGSVAGAATSVPLPPLAQHRARLAEFESQLATLRLSFHDSHPDVVRAARQIQELQEIIRLEETQQRQSASAGEDREAQRSSVEADDITRELLVNTTIYQDLMRRRENALVNVNINRAQQGLEFKIQEEAYLPSQPSGLRPRHVVLITILMSVLLPIGVIVALIFMDGRIRIGTVLAEHTKVPVLGSVPHLWSPTEVQDLENEARWGIAVVGLVLLVAIAMLTLRLVQVF